MAVLQTINAVVRRLKTDATLISLLGGAHIYRNRSRATIQNPSVTYTLLWNGIGENYAPITMQLDVWGKTYEKVLDIEKRIFELLHSDLPVVFGTLRLWSQFQNSFDYLEEDQSDHHKGIVYRLTPARLDG